jgi:hypothetical protein
MIAVASQLSHFMPEFYPPLAPRWRFFLEASKEKAGVRLRTKERPNHEHFN